MFVVIVVTYTNQILVEADTREAVQENDAYKVPQTAKTYLVTHK